jgi:hypothetical protein
MRKTLICIAALLIGAASVFAQNKEAYDYTGRFNVSVQGGMSYSLSENHFGYYDNHRVKDLFNLQGSVSLGYDFSPAFGLRLNVNYGKNSGACNVKQTHANGFWPYDFSNVDFFADAMLNLFGLAEETGPFTIKLYAGIGWAYTFGFTEAGHPWQDTYKDNGSLGLRLGGICEYDFKSGFGIFADVSGAAYTDRYNGLEPYNEDQDSYNGYAGFPFDLKAQLSLGVIYHF